MKVPHADRQKSQAAMSSLPPRLLKVTTKGAGLRRGFVGCYFVEPSAADYDGVDKMPEARQCRPRFTNRAASRHDGNA
jgi:hypothetical protein